MLPTALALSVVPENASALVRDPVRRRGMRPRTALTGFRGDEEGCFAR
jgi:hypothetical protein